MRTGNGDHVSSGDVLAEVDSSSVYEAMEELLTELEKMVRCPPWLCDFTVGYRWELHFCF